MGRSTYYSPLWGGFLFTLLAHDVVRTAIPALAKLEGTPYWLIVGAVGLATGIWAQLIMIGLQGFSAKVLPLPGGRSYRGPAAATIGALLSVGVILVVVGPLLWQQNIILTGSGLTVLGAASLIAAGIGYGWSWPSAVRDFRED